MTHPLISQSDVDTFQNDGVVLVRGLFADHVETLRRGIAVNMAMGRPAYLIVLDPANGPLGRRSTHSISH